MKRISYKIVGGILTVAISISTPMSVFALEDMDCKTIEDKDVSGSDIFEFQELPENISDEEGMSQDSIAGDDTVNTGETGTEDDSEEEIKRETDEANDAASVDRQEQQIPETEDKDIVSENGNTESEDSLSIGWKNENGSLRYYSASGDYLTGKCQVGGYWYYFDDNGVCLKSQWVTEEDKKYYAMSDGQLRVGWLSFGSTYYYCDSNAEIVTGKINISGNWYYFDGNGVRQQNGWIVDEAKKYYAMSDGTLRVGWLSFGSTYYYCNSEAEIVTGWQTIAGTRYYFDSEGIRKKPETTGWKTEGDKQYYIMPDGTARVGWLSFGDTYYYCGNDGAIVYGKQKIGSNWYFFDDDGIRQQGCWVEDENGKYYAMPDGTLRVGWLSFGNTYYYCDSNAEIVTGWQIIDGSGYYFNADGVRQNNTAGWKTEGDKQYYIMPDGTARVGWLSFGNTYYYCGNDGAIVYGKQKIGNNWYFFDEEGIRQQGCWVEDENGRYYAMPDGTLRVGWLSFGDTYYYCNSNAEIVTGIYVVDGVGYRFDENGVRQSAGDAGWYEENGSWYYIMPDGTYRVGWLSFGDTYYYCGSDGAIVYGKQSIGGKWYYFDAEGVRQSSAWYEDEDGRYYMMPDGSFRTGWLSFGDTYYYCGSNGAIVYGKQKIGNSWYYFDDNGIRQKNTWITDGTEKYYAMSDGTLRVGWLSFGDTYYYCGSDASIIRRIQYPVNGILYTFDSKGVMQKEGGWGSYNGHRYYKNPATGFPYIGWVSFGSTYYYAANNGWMVTGWQTIGGYRYYFDPDTNIMARSTMIDGIYVGSDGRASEAYTYAASILDQVGWNLRAAYDWCVGLRYIHMTEDPSPGSEWFALYGFKNGRGNCYVMAGTFYCMAKLMGYDAHQISGYVMSVGGNSPHSWVEINIGGRIYVFDVSFENGNRGDGYYFTYGTPGTWRYTDYYRMN